jgi:hypothetical protein
LVNAPSRPPAPEHATCALHTYLTLPSFLFVDKYQLSDPLFLASKNLTGIRALIGETDLEAPDWVIDSWGSNLLIELAEPATDDYSAEVPLHLRYLRPTQGTGGLTDVAVPWPIVFWACTAEEGSKMGANPFDRVNLGYDGLFGPKTMFYHISPVKGTKNALVEKIQVPVMDLGAMGATSIEWGTMAIILAGFGWITWKLFSVWRISGCGGGKAKFEMADGKNKQI